MKRIQTVLLSLALLCALLLSGCEGMLPSTASVSYDLDDLPAYSGEPYVEINENQPEFTEEEITTEAFEAVPSSAALSMYESIFLAAALLMTCLSSGSACQSTLP